MSRSDEWSPDEALGTEVYEQGDEALEEATRLEPAFDDAVEQDPSLDPSLMVDELELEEAGAELDDPEEILTLEGGSDDPDGLGEPTSRTRNRRADLAGWQLDAPLSGNGELPPNDQL
jgi:hypothetical protein